MGSCVPTGWQKGAWLVALRVLIVDDNRDAADSLAQLVGLWGYAVHVAYDGEEALQKAIEIAPDETEAETWLIAFQLFPFQLLAFQLLAFQFLPCSWCSRRRPYRKPNRKNCL